MFACLCCRWYFGKIKRIEAEKKLLLPENDHGAFLIRDSESRRNDYSLSGKDSFLLSGIISCLGPSYLKSFFQCWWLLWLFILFFLLLLVRDGDTVKHYRIRQLDEGGFFIARRTTFRTLQELVEHYSKDADGLCVNLRKPCIQASYPVVLFLLFHRLYYPESSFSSKKLLKTSPNVCQVEVDENKSATKKGFRLIFPFYSIEHSNNNFFCFSLVGDTFLRLVLTFFFCRLPQMKLVSNVMCSLFTPTVVSFI